MNGFYTKYKNRVLGSGASLLTDWDDDTISAVLTSDLYLPSIDSDEFLSDIPAGARVATQNVTGLSISFGAVVPTLTVTFSGVSGAEITRLELYKNTGVAATSPLLLLVEDFTAGMPYTPNGGDIYLAFNAAGIFQL